MADPFSAVDAKGLRVLVKSKQIDTPQAIYVFRGSTPK